MESIRLKLTGIRSRAKKWHWYVAGFLLYVFFSVDMVTGHRISIFAMGMTMAIWVVIGVAIFRPQDLPRMLGFSRSQISEEDKRFLSKATNEVDTLLSSTGVQVSPPERLQLIRDSYWKLKGGENEKSCD